jgi:RNA polymerase sigma factor for flagellar operon FliA
VTAVAIREGSGCSPTVDKLVETHVSLVGHLVRELMNRLPAHVQRDDLVSAGMMALVLAARSFDPEVGVVFSRYAAIRIKGALTDELRSMDWASRGVRSKAREIDAVGNAVAAQLGRAPSRQEVALAMGVSTADLDGVDADVHRASVVSLQGLAAGDAEQMLPATSYGPESLLLQREEIGVLHDAITELPDRLRSVIEQYFFGEQKMADIAKNMGISESRVSQLRTEALAYLRDGMRDSDSLSHRPVGNAGQSRERYRAAVSARSGLAQRLSTTSAMGDVLAPRMARAV